MNLDKIDFDKGDGLIPCVVQNFSNGKVLMLGYVNKESLEKSIEIGQLTFFSRSKNRLWTKGETSGNTLEIVSMDYDCDGDTVLVQVKPKGPACHLNTETCFQTPENQPF